MSGFQVRLLLGSEHPCSYLEARAARSAFIDPHWPLDAARYGALLHLGFRRSGAYVYRPACAACTECRPVRIRVAGFSPNRAQRRCLRSNADLRLTVGPHLTGEHYGLYRRYLEDRHPDGGMNPDDRGAFHSFLECRWGQAEVWDFRLGAQLIASAVVDRVPDAFSAVYTFFDPAFSARSLGTYAVLQQVQRARELGLDYIYLGYWVRESPKMRYKNRFQPLEILHGSQWRAAADVAVPASA